eukprot:661153-Amorphochlora_amoeboformis.AAC.1
MHTGRVTMLHRESRNSGGTVVDAPMGVYTSVIACTLDVIMDVLARESMHIGRENAHMSVFNVYI